MTDTHGRTGGVDQLGERLRALQVETDPVILVESSAVRRRGDRRRRATRAGTVLVVAVLTVGVVGIASTLTDRSGAVTAPPAATSSSRPLAADPLLRPGDIAQIGPYGPFTLRDAEPVDGLRLQCLNVRSSWGANTSAAQSYGSPLDGTFAETVLQFHDVGAATKAAARPLELFATCPAGDPDEAVVADRTELLAVGDQSYRLARSMTPTADSGLFYSELAVARIATIVVVLDWTSMGPPNGADGWAWTPDQLETALARATAPPRDPSTD